MSDEQGFGITHIAAASLLSAGIGGGATHYASIGDELLHCKPLIEHAVKHSETQMRLEALEQK